ncbi:MAG: hypothetical protein Q8K50_23415 [Hydrogenophaga sp.]|nr:hypothetical protein [Hydrogenophaga sp.]
MSDFNKYDIEDICQPLLDELNSIMSFKWDDWVGSILAEFSVEQKDAVRSILNQFLPVAWDKTNIGTAPQVIQALDQRLGGVRYSQLLFNSEPSGDAFVFCAWWPWSNGTHISLRFAPFGQNLSEKEVADLLEKMKVWARI